MRGVSYDKVRDRWTARKTVDGKRVLIGRFRTEAEANEAYEMFTALNEQNDFADIAKDIADQLIATPVSRRWRGWSGNLVSRVLSRVRRSRA